MTDGPSTPSTKISLKDLKKDLRDQLLKDFQDEIQTMKETIITEIKQYVNDINKKNVKIIGNSLKDEWIPKIEKAVLFSVKGKKTKDKNKPASPLTGYMLFSKERRPIIKDEIDPDTKEKHTFGSIGKKLGVEWKAMSDEEKKPFLDKANECKKQYEIALKEYNNKMEAAAASADSAAADSAAADSVSDVVSSSKESEKPKKVSKKKKV